MKFKLKTSNFIFLSILAVASCSKSDDYNGNPSLPTNNNDGINLDFIPGAVKDLQAKPKFMDSGKVQVELTWTKKQTAKSYTLKRGLASKTYKYTYTNVKSPYTIKNLDPGTTQHFIIILNTTLNENDIAISSKDYSIALPKEANVYDTAIPGDFGEVSAMAGDSQISLSWTASMKATKYLINRSLDDTVVQTFETSTTNYTDTGLINGTTYTYSIVAVNDNGQTKADTSVTATPVSSMIAPGNFDFNASPGDNAAVITWANSTGASSYTLKRGNSSGLYNKSDFVISTSPFIDNTVAPGQIYYYQMVATNSVGSTLSKEIAVTPRSCQTGNITISNDNDVTSFNNSGCVSISGNLSADTSNVTSFIFTNLATISGSLYLNGNSNLTNISFPKLISVETDAEFYNNSNLTSLDFPSLESVGDSATKIGSFDSNNNAALTSINTPKLKSVGGYFQTWDDMNLASLNISSLKSTGDALWIGSYNSGGYQLTNIDISSLETTIGDFWLENISLLANLTAPKLRSVGGQFIVRNAPLIQSLSAILLQNTANLDISNNPILDTVSLSALRSANDFEIHHNMSLKMCSVTNLINNNPITIHGSTNVSHNDGVGTCL